MNKRIFMKMTKEMKKGKIFPPDEIILKCGKVSMKMPTDEHGLVDVEAIPSGLFQRINEVLVHLYSMGVKMDEPYTLTLEAAPEEFEEMLES